MTASAAAAVDRDSDSDSPAPSALPWLGAEHLAWWALQFTPRVALLGDAVVLEIHASERLFGGDLALRHRIAGEARALGVRAWAYAGTALASLALARHAADAGIDHPHHADEDGDHTKEGEAGNECEAGTALVRRLDALPLHVLAGVAEHHPTLERLGCRTLSDVRRLPRGGLSRRFGAALLKALDQAYGQVPETFDWVLLPPVFDARLELPGRVESAPALLFAAQRLLAQLCAWLAGRQAGVTAFTLTWLHDWHRRDASREGRHTVRLASPTRDAQRLARLLAEHLQHIALTAPVGDIGLHADEIAPLPLDTQALFQEHGAHAGAIDAEALLSPAGRRKQHDALLALLDRLGARLGPERVRLARIVPEHRLEYAQVWQPAVAALAAMSPASLAAPSLRGDPKVAQAHAMARPAAHANANKDADADDSSLSCRKRADLLGIAHKVDPLLPQPAWLLDEPLPLALGRDGLGQHPVYQGPLRMLAGPHRIEAGWWDKHAGRALVTRDYYLASSDKAGLLWVFRSRPVPDDKRSPWFLHGFFS